ncbi:signal peptidase II [Desulfitibacter alkalitolerans]|uniref:signal peptidase II n=1 Tax=Desulfitibacter alkalitolerans TaxID=264641 RepID=UPI0004821049|nr:signal peptidase II [Desulfitibacter alkalitolerans]
MIFAVTAIVIVILDQLTKHFIIISMHPNESIPVIENIFHITFVRNPGAAFGILQNQIAFFIVVTIIVIFLLVGVYWKLARENTILTIGLSLQLGGAVGNLIDRIRFSYVVDFLDFRVWPVFNVADMAIVTGVILLAWQLLVWPEEQAG